jgi:hypothetical protein
MVKPGSHPCIDEFSNLSLILAHGGTSTTLGVAHRLAAYHVFGSMRSTEHDDDLNLLPMLQQAKCCASPAPSGNARIKMALRYSFGSFWLAIGAVIIARHGSFFRRFTASFMWN